MNRLKQWSPKLLVVAVLLFVSNVWLAATVVRMKKNIDMLSIKLVQRKDDINAVRTERRAYLDLLQSLQLDGGFLSGLRANDQVYIEHDKAIDGLYYLIDTLCSACVDNVALLNRLAVDDVHVVGLSMISSAEDLAGWANRFEVEFPLIANPTGALADMMPRIGTPITIVIRNGRVLTYIYGRLSEDDIAGLIV